MRRLASLLFVLAAAAGAGACSVGSGDSDPTGARLTVSQDFGRDALIQKGVDEIPGGETVMRFLQRNADVDTGYGGRFVNAIEGVRSGSRRGEQRDWFYYVNGIEAGEGAAERDLYGGDHVWWDYRDWGTAMRVPAVVGAFPEPFRHGAEGKRFPVRIDCAPGADDSCTAVAQRLERVGVDSSRTGIGTPAGENLLRVVVGRWEDVRHDEAVEKIEDGPAESGVFARVGGGGAGYEIAVLDGAGRVVDAIGAGGGIVAATRSEGEQPTWIVAGTDDAGLDRAVRLLGVRTLRNRYAVVADASGATALPAREGAAR